MNFLTKISNIFGGQKRAASLADGGGSFYRFLSFGWRSGQYSGEKLSDLYRRNELAYSCITKIADVMNDARLIVEKQNNKGDWEEAKGHPLAALMQKPNSQEIGLDFRKKMVQSENSLGLAYIRLIRPRSFAVPSEFYILNPNRVFPQINYSSKRIEYFRYSNALGYQEQIAPEDILIRRRADLTDEFNGLAPLAVAANTIAGDENLTDYVNSFLDGADGSAGVPAGILKFQANLSPEKALEKRKLWNKNTSAKDVQVLDQNADFVPVGSKLSEIASGDIREQNEAKICGIFGVPAVLVGAYVGLKNVTQNATAKSALKDFWLNKISPELKVLREWLTWFVLPEFEDINLIKQGKIRVGWDLSQMLALQEDLNELHARHTTSFRAGAMTLNEYRTAIGLDSDPHGDYYMRISSFTPVLPEQAGVQAALGMVSKLFTTPDKIESGENIAPTGQNNSIETPKRFQLKAATVHEFSSTQIDLPLAEKRVILAFGKEFIADDDLADTLEWEPREDKPHITVKFGLHADNADELKDLLADVAPFEVTLGKTSIFPGNDENDYDVVKIDVESSELHVINKLIADNLETTDTHPKYVPHLTLAYVKKGKGEDYAGDETFDGQKISFDKITFSDKNRKKTIIKLTGAKSQKKTFDFDGLILSRAPNEIEQLIDLKSLVTDLANQSGNLEKSLLKYRETLINQAIDLIKQTDAQNIYALTLDRSEKQAKIVKNSLIDAFNQGRKQVVREINAQKQAKNFNNLLEYKDLSDDLEERLDELSDSVISKILNEVQSRAINAFTALKLLGFDAGMFFDELKKRLFGESDAFVKLLSRNAANAAVMEGRAEEIFSQKENWDRIQYSAILDANTCESCNDADGLESNDENDLPDVPNPECDGGSSCRCFWVVILD